ncbi:eIF2A-related protein [Aerosakkonema funiforme]|uniref:nSTAND1 domain-containing NTPase n=1 Tax=Aerosakkonema funiforme TaxID=1246630 RepID=UPI0035B74EAB
MGRLVVLKIGKGNFNDGFPVTLEIGEDDALPLTVISGILPSMPKIPEYYRSWQSSYRQLEWFPRTLKRKQTQVKNVSFLQDCDISALTLSNSLNIWLNSVEFFPIKAKFFKQLNSSDEIRLVIQTNDLLLRRLPWHLWELILNDYPNTEIIFSPSEYEELKEISSKTRKKQVKILVILGDSTDIEVKEDLRLLQQRLPDAYILPLINPQLDELSDRLWEQEWDILYFAGHSSSDFGNGQGKLKINDTESITIEDLKFAFRKAIACGLQLAIFNSCDGLGLAQDLEKLQLTASIVMRERIPDEAAQKFLEYFLLSFAEQGKSLYTSVRESRERLHSLNKEYPCASWLPVICEHPKASKLTWYKLGGILPCPYRGLSAFSEQDAHLFFGREAFTNQLIEAVNQKSLVTVIGASGSGKSSVVFAGLIPHLRAEPTSELPLQIASIRPGNNPFKALASALISAQNLSISNNDKKLIELELEIELQQNDTIFYKTIESIVQQGNGKRFLLVIDQFEELYTLCPETKQQVFLNGLLMAVKQALEFTLVLTLRADFFGRILGYEPFGKALQEYPPELLIPMNPDQLKAAIVKPSQQLGIELEQGLRERLINVVGKQPGYLPLLEFTLTQLWRTQKQNLLSLEAYEKIGGIEKALTNHAKQVYIQLNKTKRQRLEKIFIQLVHPGEGTEDTRRLATRSQIGEDSWNLVMDLATKYLVVTNCDRQTGEETVEIVHEALIQNWKQLQKWVQRNRDFRRWQERLRTAMQNWKTQHNWDEGALLSGAPLAEAKDWLQQRPDEISLDERQFIEKSIELQQKRDRLQKCGILALLIFAMIAFQQWQQAEYQKKLIQISNINYYSESLLLSKSGKEFEALIEIIRAARILQQTDKTEPELPIQVAATIQQALHNIRERNRLEQHSDNVMSVTFSPDGQTIASASFDNSVKLWKRDGTLLKTLKGHKDAVFDVSFSPDGNLIASASFDKTVKLWRRDGILLRTLNGHSDRVLSVSFSPNGQTIATASQDKTIKLWKRDGTLLKTLQGHTGTVFDVTFSPNGQTIASASWDKTVKLWNLKGDLLQTLEGHKDQVDSVSFSPDGQLIATASADEDKTIKLWKYDSNKKAYNLYKILKGHNNTIYSVSFSPDGQKIASASKDGTIKLWTREGVLLETFLGHTNNVNSISFSPDGKTMASGSGDSTIRLWNLSRNHILKGHKREIDDVTFSSDGQGIATVSRDGTGRVWNLLGKQLIQFQERANNVSFSPNGQIIATANDDKTVKLWSHKGILLKTFKGHTDRVFDISFSPNNQLIASASFDKTVKLWTLDGTLQKTLKGHSDQVWSVSFSPDGQTIATASRDRTVKLWNLDGSLKRTLWGHNDGVLNVSFSPNGQTIATASQDNTVKLWKFDGTLLHTLKGHTGIVNSVSFSSDGQTIASGSDDSTVRLWSLEGRLLKTLQGHNQRVYSVSFSPQGQLLASAGREGIVILWDLDLDSLTNRACDWVRDYLKTNRNAESDRTLCN